MPHYDYFCTNCPHQQEYLQKMSDPILTTCPVCHKESFKRKIGRGTGVVFRGTGFYETDYKNKNSSDKVDAPKNSCYPCNKQTCADN